jgi:hypothetical protein
MNQWLILAVVVISTIAIIAHNEWRYRRLVEWLDAIGEMISDYQASRKGE